MKTTLRALRHIIQETLDEVGDLPTISSELSPDEQELKTKFPKWGSSMSMKAATPQIVKKHQVEQELSKSGYGKDATHKRTISQELPAFLGKIEPAELFVSDPSELAAQFADSYLKQR